MAAEFCAFLNLNVRLSTGFHREPARDAELIGAAGRNRERSGAAGVGRTGEPAYAMQAVA